MKLLSNLKITTLVFFSDTGPPTVFMLVILSHGDADGVIYTDQGDSFTIYDVWDALADNQLLDDCLKINVFGVRGKIIIFFIII
jgi:hypothetical protein